MKPFIASEAYSLMMRRRVKVVLENPINKMQVGMLEFSYEPFVTSALPVFNLRNTRKILQEQKKLHLKTLREDPRWPGIKGKIRIFDITNPKP